jgi:hypothetical protein
MKAVVRDGYSELNTQYFQSNNSNGYVRIYIDGLEMELLRIVLQKMNMTFVHVPTPEGYQDDGYIHNLIWSMWYKMFI